jgi:uncharacterized protein YbaP (TraB family)
MKTLLHAFGLLLALSLPGLAQCQGQDLIAALPPQARADLAPDVPFAKGNLWQARRGDAQLLLIGTYHLDDPRFGPLAEALAPALQAATGLFVELSPKDEAALKAQIASNPDTVFDQSGPSLRDQLGEADWARLAKALASRGTPAPAALKMRPWVVAAMLEAPACLMSATVERGLDRRLTTLATTQDLPVTSLEPADTALKVFAALTPADQLEMIRQALMAEPQAEDMAVTLTEAYFRGEAQLYLAFTRAEAIRLGMDPAEVDRQMAVMFAALLDGRNAAWIPVLEAAQGPHVAAFGALHLGGEKGVLNLLAARGWTVTQWTPGDAWPAP